MTTLFTDVTISVTENTGYSKQLNRTSMYSATALRAAAVPNETRVSQHEHSRDLSTSCKSQPLDGVRELSKEEIQKYTFTQFSACSQSKVGVG